MHVGSIHYDFYGDNLLSQEKKGNLITREIILEILGKTEEHIKEGFIYNWGPTFFLWSIDCSWEFFILFIGWFYQYDPPIRNH